MPGRPNKACFPKEDFQIDLEAGTCTCPAGNVTHTLRTFGTRSNRLGRTYLARSFQFDPAVCGVCPLQCVAARYGAGRTVTLPVGCARRPIAWRGWCNWGSANLATSAEPRPDSNFGGHGGQLTLVATKMGMRLPPLTINRTSKPQGRPSLTQFILAAATGSLLASYLQSWLSSTPSRHSGQPGF